MKPGSRRTILGCLGAAVACLLCGTLASGQTAPPQKPQMAEDVLKNIQVLRGIPMDEFMGTMGFFASALSLNCIDCHVKEAAGNWARYADDTPLKQTARKMVLMVRTINQANFGGKPVITCYTCHRSSDTPKAIPSIAEQYGTVPDIDPNEVKTEGPATAAGAPSADQILDKYIQALGGAQKLANLSSFVAKGTYQGFETAGAPVPVEVYAKAPAQRTTMAHVPAGAGGLTKDITWTFDGQNGWVAARSTLVPELTLTGGLLDGAKVDAELSFPGQIKQALVDWNANFQETNIDDHPVRVIQGTSGKSLVKLYFDKQSGLLVRQVRYANTIVGINPTQVDYSDYRDVPGTGVKLPFHWIMSWTDGQSTFIMSQVQTNAPIDAAKFAKPNP